MNYRYVILLLVLHYFSAVNASNLDSLEKLLHLPSYQTYPKQLKLLKDIGEGFITAGDFSKGLIYYEKATHFAKGEDKFEPRYKVLMCQNRLQAYDKVLKGSEILLKEGQEDKVLVSKTYGLMSSAELALGNSNVAYELQHKGLEISENLNDTLGLFKANYQIGTIHFYQSNYKLALKYYKKALEYALLLGDKRNIYSGLGAVGSTYHRVNDIKQSVHYNLKSLVLAKALSYDVGIAYAASNVGADYFELEKYDTALTYFHQALALQQKQQDKWGQVSSFRMLGECYKSLSDWNNSLAFAKEGLKIAEEIQAKPMIVESYETLARIYEAKKDFENANLYWKSFLQLKETLINEETVQKIEATQTTIKCFSESGKF